MPSFTASAEISAKGRLEILVNVVAERFERRHVEYERAIRQISLRGGSNKFIEANEESG